MKTRLLGLIMLLCTFAAKAQYVTIPDNNFVTWLQTYGYGNCMNGNQMDTTCYEVRSATEIRCQLFNISNLDGIQYFDSLKLLSCVGNNLAQLPPLPKTLRDLYIDDNNFSVLPSLPDTLDDFTCNGNQLSTLPALPSWLLTFECNNNQLTQLPQLPSTVNYLKCDNNQLTSLPNIPLSLQNISCVNNQLTSLPPLQQSLYLREINCSNNQLTSLPNLPVSTFFVTLKCSNNPLSALPAIPNSLKTLHCTNTAITSLPILPPLMNDLQCQSNNISYIPNLPGRIVSGCYLQNNPNLSCLPAIGKMGVLNISNTNITCLPNYGDVNSSSPALLTLPLCQPFNGNGCEVFWNIAGNVFWDSDNNCNYNGNDVSLSNNAVILSYNNNTLTQFTNNTGLYSFDIDSNATYSLGIDTTGLPFTVLCPVGGVYNDTLSPTDSLHFNRNFALQCKTGFDLAAHSVASAMVFRPANNTVVDILAGDLANFYSASCAQGVSGVVTVTLNGPISYVSPATNAVTPSNVSNNIITWNVADFGTADALNDFNIIIQTDTFAQSGQQACFDVKVTPLTGDNDTSNNHLYFCFNIVNSYDPNDKTAYPAGNIDTTQEWLTYRVRFQNTGTAEAQHIYIMDTLDANVKVETFQLLSYSHQPNVQINENIVRFNFPNINLPDSISDEPGSHGYVQYKVKLKEDLAIGTAINNTAYIYFDFNPPVVTNTATNTIAVEADTIEVGIKPISKNFELLVYPNPANQQVTVTASEPGQAIAIYNTQGKLITTQTMQGNVETLNISALPSGVYYIEVKGKSSIARKKFVKL